jgi:hypothetical protein
MLLTSFRTIALLATLTACAADRAAVHRTVDGSLLIAESGPDTGIGITAELDGREVVCRNSDRDAAPIGFILFERRDMAMAYGVYGLGLAKNPMGANRPLDGAPIAWPGKDHAQGLAHLLERALPVAEATALVERNGAHWFRPGLRVFFVMPGTPEDLAAVPGASAATGALRIVTLE